MYLVGVGDSPMQIASKLSGDPTRYQELLAANPHKNIVYVNGQPTFDALSVGELLHVPIGMDDPGVGVGASVTLSQLDPGRGIGKGQSLRSPNGRAELVMQSDGNLVLYDNQGHHALWASNTQGKPSDHAIMQPDGNFVVYDAQNHPLWASGTDKHPGSVARIQDDGNFVVYQNAVPKWSTNTNGFTRRDSGGGIFDAIKNVASSALDVVTDPAALAKLTAGGPLAILSEADAVLHKAGIPVPSDILRKAGLPASADDALHKVGLPATPEEALHRVGLPSTPGEVATRLGLPDITKLIPKAPDPTAIVKDLAEAAASGDIKKIEDTALRYGHELGDALAMVPALGTPFAAALNTALTALESGSPLITALEALLSLVPLPTAPIDFKEVIFRPAIHIISDVVEKHQSVTDAMLSSFKEGLVDEAKSKGLPDVLTKVLNDLIDGIIQVIVKHKPIDTAATDFAMKGIETAKNAATKQFGANIPPAVQSEIDKAKQSYDQIKSIANTSNELHLATQGLAHLKKLAPTLTTQKQITDLRTGMAAKTNVLRGAHAKLQANRPIRPKVARPVAPEAPAAMPAAPVSSLAPPAAVPSPNVVAQQLYGKAPLPQSQFVRTMPEDPGVSAPVHLPHHAGAILAPHHASPSVAAHQGGGHPEGHGHRHYAGGGDPFWAGRTVIDQTCNSWGEPVEMTPAMNAAARAALTVSGGQPYVEYGYDGARYLFSSENGVLMARPCMTTVGTGGC